MVGRLPANLRHFLKKKRKKKKNVIIHEIIFSFFLLLLLLLTVQFCISTSHGTLGRPCVTIVDPQGGRLGSLQARKRPKQAPNHKIFLCLPSMQLTPSFPTVRVCHSKMLYLDISWNTRSSGNVGDPGGGWGPL